MNKAISRVFLAAAGLACLWMVSISLGVQAEKPKTTQTVKEAAELQQTEPKDFSVSVEAYLVQVNMDALYGKGVDRLPQEDKKDVTVAKLNAVLADAKNGKVIGAARTIAKGNERANTRREQTKYFKKTQKSMIRGDKSPVEAESYTISSYNSSSSLSVRAISDISGQIILDVSFRYSGLGLNTEDASKDDIPPNQVVYDLDDVLTVKAGQPLIVAGGQDAETGLFLVLRADIVK